MLSGAYEKAFILISFKIERKKQKWSHRCRKQTYGSQGESWVGGVDKLGGRDRPAHITVHKT